MIFKVYKFRIHHAIEESIVRCLWIVVSIYLFTLVKNSYSVMLIPYKIEKQEVVHILLWLVYSCDGGIDQTDI